MMCIIMLLFSIFKNVKGKETDVERALLDWFTPQMPIADRAEPDQQQELRTPPGSPAWMAGIQVFGPCFVASQVH